MLAPAEVTRRRELILVDLRPHDERMALGFIPTSVSVPSSGDHGELLAWLDWWRPAAGVVLHCTSGRRSAAAWQALSGRASVPLHHLDGGLHAWEAAGLPVCRVRDATLVEPLTDALAFRRHLLACFVAETTEVSLDHDRAPGDPEATLRACFREAGVAWDAPTVEGLHRVLDLTALATYQAGGDLEHIAANLAAMLALLRTVLR